MKEKRQNITITLKKSDKLTMKFLDGKILSGEVTNIAILDMMEYTGKKCVIKIKSNNVNK